MKLDPNKDLLQKNKPSNSWLVKDTNTNIIRAVSQNVDIPLSPENETVMHKLIDFVRWSQDSNLNRKSGDDYLRPAVGLAAPQIGSNTNMFFVRFEHEKEGDIEYAMINCKITATSAQKVALENGEGCLSVDKDVPGIVPRAYKIEVEGYDWLTKQYIKKTLRGYQAIVFQHECEHIMGKLYYDLINKKNPDFTDPDWLLI